MGRTVGELVGRRWARTEPAPEQPLELPVPVLAHSARDRPIAPNTSTYQYYSLVPVLTSSTYVFPESSLEPSQKVPLNIEKGACFEASEKYKFLVTFSDNGNIFEGRIVHNP